MMKRILLYTFLGLLVLGGAALLLQESIGRMLVAYLEPEYQADDGGLQAAFSGPDAKRSRISVALHPVGPADFFEVTDIQFPPGQSEVGWILQKKGQLKALNIKTGQTKLLTTIKVTTVSEQGLLGLAFHPKFATNGRFYLNYTQKFKGDDYSIVAEYRTTAPQKSFKGKLKKKRTIMRLRQPYQNHNGGQLQFGPDGMLYIGWGDGGLRDDPGNHGQRKKTLLGAMLRIDVDSAGPKGQGYAIPADNPFVGQKAYAPEIYAIGFRNPWRYSFDSKGRLVVADVGQDLWEEVSLVVAGENYGWRIWEASHCFNDQVDLCQKTKKQMVGPIYEYGHGEGASITGGYVYNGNLIAGLQGKYVFGDFVSGRLWAMDLPTNARAGLQKNVYALGKWPILPSTFGRSANGEVYVGDYAKGLIYQIRAAGAQ